MAPRAGKKLWVMLASALVSLGLAATTALGAALPGSSPLAGSALWIKEVSPQSTPQALAAEGLQTGARTLYMKAGDGSEGDPQFSPLLVGELRAAGISVCGWTFAYGRNPSAEAAVAVAAARAGAQCLVIDAEGEYDGLYGPAHLFVSALRSQLGAHFSIALAGQAEISQHPAFPYSVFLGPGGFNMDMPQIYWRDFGVSVDAAFTATLGVNSIYGRPIEPVGQLYGSPTASELERFRALAQAYRLGGLSFFDLDSAAPEQLSGLTAPLAPLPRRAIAAPTLHPGADSDEVVWAQELLNAAGAHLPVGGYYGAQTARAVARFQSTRRLPATGVLGPATWRALERLHPRELSWAKGPPDSAR